MQVLAIFGLFLLAAAVKTAEMDEKMLKIKDVCVKESGVNEDLVVGVQKGEFPEDSLLKDFFVCVGKKTGIIGEDGKNDKEILKKQMTAKFGDKPNLDAIVDECLAIQKATLQDSVYEQTKCLFTKLH